MAKRRKRGWAIFFAVFFAVAILFGVAVSCDKIWEFHLHGLDEYAPETSSIGLSSHLLPSETFLEDYSYVAGDYYYEDYGPFKEWERLLLWLQYDAEEYQRAKEFCLTEMTFREEPLGDCGKYTFYENMDYAEAAYTYSSDSDYRYYITEENKIFPYVFTAFSFNDEKQILIFMGFGTGVKEKTEAEKYYDQGFESFVKYYFPMYDFEAE